ncbi:MAG: hypothetical protein ABGW50_02190, partial [Thermococcus sp.]
MKTRTLVAIALILLVQPHVLAVQPSHLWSYSDTCAVFSMAINGNATIGLAFDGIELDWVPDYGALSISAGKSFMLDGAFETVTDNDAIESWCQAGVFEADVSEDTTDNGTPFA